MSSQKGVPIHRLLAVALACMATLTQALFGQEPDLPAGPGKEVVQRACNSCHSLTVVTGQRLAAESWGAIVQNMIARGAKVNDDDAKLITNYLSSNFHTVVSTDGTRGDADDKAPSQAALPAAPRNGRSDWPIWGHDNGGSQYSPLSQINLKNVTQLQQAWVYHYGAGTADLGDLGLDYRFEVTPLLVGGVMYVFTPASPRNSSLKSAVVALEPETGKVLWKFESDKIIHGRALAYWPGDKQTAPRLFVGLQGGQIAAIDVRTGALAPTFGTSGYVDAYSGLASERVPAVWRERFSIPNPVTIWRNLVITGTRPGELGPPGPVGDIRAWDAVTGKLVWTFHTVPQAGEPGNESWASGSWKDRTGVNNWSSMTVDVARGIVFIPIASPSVDAKGADRAGDNLYSDSLIALHAASGKLLWYRQLTHHDLWDSDLPTPPVLIEVRRGQRVIPAVAQTGKTGQLFLFDRRTGLPLFPIEERPVPSGDDPNQHASPTQPFSTALPSLARNSMTRDDITTLTPEAQSYCTKLWDQNNTVNQGPYTLPLNGHATVNFPGPFGGPNWGGPSFDRKLGLLFLNSMDWPSFRGALDQTSPTGPFFFATRGVRFPCWKPPYGELIAVNVSTGKVAWRVPLGQSNFVGAEGAATGAFNSGGNISTAGGLVFIAATADRKLRAFDERTGAEVWSTELPADGHATPVTYMGRNGKQYVVVAAGGGTPVSGTHTSDSLVAYTLR